MTRTRRAPEEIPDEQYEQVFERVCAIDVAKEFGQVCVRTPRADGKRASTVFAVDATTGDILKLGESLLEQGIEMITLESTSDYWRIFYYLLEGCGLPVQLVNARDVKNVPGRPKSDKHDCVWLAKLTERGMLRPSFVPPHEVRVLRDYTRTRIDLTRDRTRHWQRLEKLLEDALIKVTTVASKITTMSVRDMINALIRGERDPEALADLARGVMRDKRRDLVRALDGRFDDHHAELAKILLGQIDSLTAEIGRLTTRIEQLVDKLPTPEHPVDPDGGATPQPSPGNAQPATAPSQPRPVLQRLADIPGINLDAAEVILAEIGLDMNRFPTPEHLCSWARLTPQLIQSGNKRRGGKTSKGNPYLKWRTRQRRRVRLPHEHLPRRALPPHHQTPRQRQSPRRGRPLHPRHRLAPARQPQRRLPRPRRRLLRKPHRQGATQAPTHPTTRSARPTGNPHPSRRLNTAQRTARPTTAGPPTHALAYVGFRSGAPVNT